MSDDQRELEHYIAGYFSAEELQDRIKKGDPQVSTLFQFLATLPAESRDQCIVDFGAGKGIAAICLNALDRDPCPMYVAVDLEKQLAQLSLPPRIHNNSLKISANELPKTLPDFGARVIGMVVRNVLHELDIFQTAQLLTLIRQQLPPSAVVHVQDLQDLQRIERGCAGWDPEELESALRELGFKVQRFDLESHSGRRWFAMNVESGDGPLTESEVAKSLARARRRQMDHLIEEFPDRDEAVEPAVGMRLESYISGITIQLRAFEKRYGNVGDTSPKAQQAENIPPVTPEWLPIFSSDTLGPHEFAFVVPEEIHDRSGLSALLANKRMLDLRSLFDLATGVIWMAGFSQRSLFKDTNLVSSLQRAIARGVDVRLLLVDPESAVVSVRSRDPVYPSPDTLRTDIVEVIQECGCFAANLVHQDNRGKFEFRLTERMPYASYFIVDSHTYMSIYTGSVSGSRGICFVFSEQANALYGLHSVLNQEFVSSWESARPFGGGHGQ
ncbi:MAG: hypothetical protein JSS72_03490 [Armatimonadetes bacterium]|nr:hypothetical protein [Armatimonadota bacterium]